MPSVVEFDDALQLILADMFATNTAASGAGLAAPQVGVLASVVYDCVDENFDRQVGVVCNPSVEKRWRSSSAGDVGGRLSVAARWVCELARPAVPVCRGQDQYGDPVEVRGPGCSRVASSTRPTTPTGSVR